MFKLLRIVLGVAAGYIFVRGVYTFYLLPNHELWSEKYRLAWVFGAVGIGILILLVIAGLLTAFFRPDVLSRIKSPVIQFRQRIGIWGWLVVSLLILLSMIVLFFNIVGTIFTGMPMRLFLGLCLGIILAFLITRSDTDFVQPGTLVFAFVLVGSAHIIADYLTSVTSYPFSIFWSEGNRFYDYSVILGSKRYLFPGKLTLPYDSPGRYILWGILFAFPNTPIWLHRLWDALVVNVPAILFGYLVARWSHFGRLAKWSLALWFFLFLFQAPVYAPLFISAAIVVLTVRSKYIWLAFVGVALAGYYASASRWTWFPAPPIWAVVILVSRLEIQPGENWKTVFRKLIPIALVGLVGLAAGFARNADFFTPEEISASTVVDQPLLWYRLLPNATYPSGILLATLFSTGPAVALLAWAILTGWWQTNWLQKLAYLSAFLATLLVGLVISVKIGGGNNLHNMDMFFITLVILIGLMLRGRDETIWKSWPALVQMLLVLVIALPVGRAMNQGGPLRLPPVAEVTEALDAIRSEVDKAKVEGEVLFMDQRQLLTFGYIRDVPLIDVYEKKFMMDMAMGNNAEYFTSFYDDLAKQRFALIISEPLRIPTKAESDVFGEENNAWVEWVAKPVLCYYEPDETFKSVGVQLLVPRSDPGDCP